MSFLISDIIEFIQELAPEKTALEWDNPGLQAGDAGCEVSAVLTAVDLSLPVIEEAVKMGANLIITHHPLIFRPLKKIDFTTPQGKMIRELITGGVNHYAAHTNLDKSPLGTGAFLCKKLGMARVRPCSDDLADEMSMVYKGEFHPPLKPEELGEFFSEKLGAGQFRISGNPQGPVSNAAVIPGSGGSLLGKLPLDFQLIITGEMSYHDALSSFWRGQSAVLLGHFVSEKPAMDKLAERIAERFPGLSAKGSLCESEPFRVL